jgi:branched-chain amino acid transport system substrate-binding protein
MRTFMQTLLLALLTVTLGCSPAAAPPLVVGHVSDKTRLDKSGQHAELGIRLALKEATDAKLAEALGGRGIQVRHTDANGNIEAFESESVRLDAINRSIALLGGLSAAEVTALDHVKTPILTFYGHPLAGAGKNVFYLGMAASRQGTVLAKTVAENAKVKRVAVLIDERLPEATTVSDHFAQVFRDARKGDKAKPIAILTLRYGKEVKWAEFVERLESDGPQAIVFAGALTDFNAWHKVFRKESTLHEPELIYAGQDITPGGDQRPFDLGSDKPSVLFATAFHPEMASDKMTAFRKSYRDSFQEGEPTVHAALAYDGFRILTEAIKRAHPNHTSGEKLREELLNTKDFESLTGPLTINADRQVERPLHVMRWAGGTLTHVKKFDAAP